MLTRMGAPVQSQARLCKAVVQSVLLYGSEILVVKITMLKVLDGFHYLLARRITGKTNWRTVNGEWEWPPVAYALDIAGLWHIKAAGHHCGAHCLIAHVSAVQKGVEDAGVYLIHEGVVSGCGTGGRVTRR